MSIPITIGVTGHRDLTEESVEILQKVVHDELEKIKYLCPNSELVMLNSLASGADTLCAIEALKLGYRLECPLPVELDLYRNDFSDDEKTVLDELVSKADRVFVAPNVEEGEISRNYHFRQAGIYVASHSHVLMALWDGESPKNDGCGTAEAVDFMLNRSYASDSSFTAMDGAVIHVLTPRKSKNSRLVPTANLIENSDGMLLSVLKKTDEYNADIKNVESKKRKLLDYNGKPETVEKLEMCNAQAAALSQYFQKYYLDSIKLLSVFSVLLVMTYLLYDNGNLIPMLLVYGGVIALYYFFYRKIVHGKYHQKYIDYRMLAECSRVQTFLCALGIENNAAQFYTWTQKHETVWIKTAIDCITDGSAIKTADTRLVTDSWIMDQLSYNKSALNKNNSRYVSAEKVSLSMLIITIVLFIIVLVLEFLCSNFMNSYVIGLELRSWFKILWGTISAVTVFVSGFYGNLSLDRKAQDNEKMAALFETALKKLESNDNDLDEVFLQLAREEIIENGNWASYCRENKPMFSL